MADVHDSPLSYQFMNKIPSIRVLLIFINVFKNSFLKFSHVSDDGSEVDSKYNIYPSFVIVISLI